MKSFRRTKSEWYTLFTPAHWGLGVQNLVDKCAEITPPTWAKLWQLGSCQRQFDHRRTKQVGRHRAVYVRSNRLKILMVKGPSGPRVGGRMVKT